MVVAKFKTEDLDEFIHCIKDFESKLIVWESMNPLAVWELNTYLGSYDYIIEVIVDDGTKLDY
tara:strand:+ start:756 stop:944 length:189 start_codon:yes stop_codon:yes gene_type:complete